MSGSAREYASSWTPSRYVSPSTSTGTPSRPPSTFWIVRIATPTWPSLIRRDSPTSSISGARLSRKCG